MNTDKPKPIQKWVILEHLKRGEEITALDALNLYGVFRLAARINELKGTGFNIDSRSVKTPGGATIASYKLILPNQTQTKLML